MLDAADDGAWPQLTAVSTVEPGIELLSNGRYRASVRLGTHKPVRKRFPAGTSLKTIRTWRAKQRLALSKIVPRLTSGTFASDVRAHLQTLADRPLLHQERTRQLAFWSEHVGPMDRGAITPHDLKVAFVKLHASGKSVSTCRHYRTALIAFFDERGGLETNPARDLPLLADPKLLPRAAPYALIRVVLDAMSDQGRATKDGPRHDGSLAKARCRIMAYTGLRHSELMRLQPAHWLRDEHALVVTTGKDGKDRTLPLTADAEAALADLDRLHGWGAFSRSTLHRAWTRACAAADVEGIRPYDLRHSFGTALYQATGDLRIVAELLGHRSMKTTQRYTLGYVPAYMRVAIDRFSAITQRVPTAPVETPALEMPRIATGTRS